MYNLIIRVWISEFKLQQINLMGGIELEKIKDYASKYSKFFIKDFKEEIEWFDCRLPSPINTLPESYVTDIFNYKNIDGGRFSFQFAIEKV